MRGRNVLPAIVGAASLALLAGCRVTDAAQPPHARDPEYSIGFYNGSDQKLRDVDAEWSANGYPCVAIAGILSPDKGSHGIGAVNGFQPDPIPNEVTVRWKTADGNSHQQQIEVASQVPDREHFSGVIYLRYSRPRDRDRWAVVSVTYLEQKRLATAGKSMVPPDPPEPGTAPATPPVPRPALRATTQANGSTASASPGLAERQSPDAGTVLDALKFSHLASMRAELLPIGDYCQSPDAPTQRFIDACSRLSASAHQLSDAIRDKFGEQPPGELQLQFPDPATLLKESWPEVKESGDPFPAALEQAKMDVRGDLATVRMGNESIDVRKIDGRWKVQVPSMSKLAAAMGLGGDPHADPARMARDSDWVASIDQQLAADVRAGKFQTAAQVGEARSKRQQEVGELLKKNPDLYLPNPPESK